MVPSETMAYNMHLIRWQGEYLLSGMMYGEEMTEKDIKHYRTEPLKTPWILSEASLKTMHDSTYARICWNNMVIKTSNIQQGTMILML